MSLTVTERGLVHDLDERVYHSDPVEGGSLSSTGAKEILRSPAHYRHYMDSSREPKPQFDFGSAVHTLVLGVGWDIEPLGFDSWRTKDAKEARAEVEAQGKVALLRKDFDRAEAVAISVLEHPSAGKLFRKGDAEVSAFGQHRSGVWLRGRFDWLVNGTLIDLKTVQSADPVQSHRLGLRVRRPGRPLHGDLPSRHGGAAQGVRPRAGREGAALRGLRGPA